MPRRTIRMTNPKPPRKRSFLLFHLHLPTHRPRILLRFIPKQRNLKYRSNPSPNTNSNCLRRLRSALRTNVFLRSNSYHKPFLSNPIHWTNTGRMTMRWILSRQPHTNPILCLPLPPTLCNRRPNTSSPNLPSRNRLKQPARYSLRLRQNPIPPILLNQRSTRIRTNAHPSHHPGSILPKPSRRPRKFHARQSSSHAPTH